MPREGSNANEDRVAAASERATTRLNSRINRDIRRMQTAVTELEEKIVSEARKLQTTSAGRLVGPRVNLKLAQKMHTAMSVQFEELYGREITRHVRGYEDVANWVLDNFNDLDVAADFTDIDRTMIQQLTQQNVIEFTTLGNQARDRIAQSMYNSIAAQAPREELVNMISAALTGKLSTRGRPLSQYAELYANDAIMNFYNSVHLEKGRQLGMNWFLYTGTIMANTRDFCRKRVGKVYSEAQINSWTHNWSGKRGNALIYRGGWNCRHHWQPVKKDWVEDRELPQAGKKVKADQNPMTSIGRLSDCCVAGK